MRVKANSSTKSMMREKNVLEIKKTLRLVILAAIALAVALIAGLALNRVNALKLPSTEDVLSVSMNQYIERSEVGEIVLTDKSVMNDIFKALSGATKTMRQSIHDYPVSKDYFVIRVQLEGEQRTLCLYTEGVDYIEEPYIGIYRPKASDFHYISSIYAAQEKTVVRNPSETDVSSLGHVISEDKEMTLENARNLAAKGDAIRVEDFAEYNGRDVGSGLYILVFHVKGGYELWAGFGDMTAAPMYVRLYIPGFEEYIDIRSEDIDAFINRYPVPDEIRSQIDQHLEVIMSSPLYSSAPGDYIKAHQTEYNAILDLAITAFPALTDILIGGDRGLRGAVVTQALNDMIERESSKPQNDWSKGELQRAESIIKRHSEGIPFSEAGNTTSDEIPVLQNGST